MKYGAKSNKQAGANQPGQRVSGRNTKRKSNDRHSLGLKPQMESILSLVAEWVSVKEMKALQGACMGSSSMARDQQYEELLSSLDDQVWNELSDEWQRYLWEKRRKSCLVNSS